MAWQTDDWKQEDSVFYGYPIPTGSESPGVIDKSKLPNIWNFDDDFYGYPHIAGSPGVIDKSALPTIWIFDDAFYGYPHVVELMDNPYTIFLGTRPVDAIYIGDVLVWKDNGVNKIILKEES